MNLDSIDLKAVDPEEMYRRVSELPKQILDAWDLVKGLELPASYREVENVVVLGMGGSAIGGDIARTLVESRCPVPVQVSRDYDPPAYVGDSTLVIASSYSGNTEETLSALDQALAAGAKGVAVGTGGKIEARAKEAGIPFVKFDYRSSPRAAMGYSFMCVAGILRAAGFMDLEEAEVREAAAVMEDWQSELAPDVPSESNQAKQLAQRMHGRLPVIYGAGILSEVARRWKTQINENSKAWAFYEIMPELNHNAVLGFANPGDADDRLLVVMLRSQSDHPRVGVRYDVTAKLLEDRGVPVAPVWARGHSPLARTLSAIHFGDYVSLYLAYLYDADPTPVDAISYLKDQLAKA